MYISSFLIHEKENQKITAPLPSIVRMVEISEQNMDIDNFLSRIRCRCDAICEAY